MRDSWLSTPMSCAESPHGFGWKCVSGMLCSVAAWGFHRVHHRASVCARRCQAQRRPSAFSDSSIQGFGIAKVRTLRNGEMQRATCTSLARQTSGAMQASKSGTALPTTEEEEVPKWPIYAFIGVVFIGMPLMPTSRSGGLFAKIVGAVYNRVGATGLLAIPFVSLTAEKSTYDTYCAYWGNDIYAASKSSGDAPKHGGFPSGGAALPSLSLIKTRTDLEKDRATFRNELLDKAWCLARGIGS